MFNFTGISKILLIGVVSGILIGWFSSKDYYLDAETEVFIKALKKMPAKKRSIIEGFIFKNYAS